MLLGVVLRMRILRSRTECASLRTCLSLQNVYGVCQRGKGAESGEREANMNVLKAYKKDDEDSKQQNDQSFCVASLDNFKFYQVEATHFFILRRRLSFKRQGSL